jgi:NADPH-dependent curcumin reductase CurA
MNHYIPPENLNLQSIDTRSYIPPVPINGIMRGGALSQVIASRSQKYRVGEHVYAVTGWTELAICDDSSRDLQSVENILRNGGENARLTDALGVLGMCNLFASIFEW